MDPDLLFCADSGALILTTPKKNLAEKWIWTRGKRGKIAEICRFLGGSSFSAIFPFFSGGPNPILSAIFSLVLPEAQKCLVSHYSAIGDTISCDAPCGAIGFRGRIFLQYPPSKSCLWIAIGHFYGKKWGCSSDSLRYHRKHSAKGVLLHLSRDRGLGSLPGQRNCKACFQRHLL